VLIVLMLVEDLQPILGGLTAEEEQAARNGLARLSIWLKVAIQLIIYWRDKAISIRAIITGRTLGSYHGMHLS